MRLPFIEIKVHLNDEQATVVPIDHVVFDDGIVKVYVEEKKALPIVKVKSAYEACEYEDRYDAEEQGYVPYCRVHNRQSKYVSNEGPNRPCLAVEAYGTYGDET